MQLPLSVDIVSDVVCPFCYIGLARVEQALEQEGAASATIAFHPFLLDPDTPPGGEDLRERLRRKYGGDPEAMFGRVEAMARESGLPLDFAKVRRSASTVGAHTLLRHAKERGTQVALARALFEAYFLEGADISDVDVLAALAVRHGFEDVDARALVVSASEDAATRAEAAAAAARRGVSGVPLTIFAGELAVSGAQPVEVFREAIRRVRASAP